MHNHVERLGFDSDVYVQKLGFDFILKKKKKKMKLGFDLDEQPWGNMSDARKFFDESPLLELVSWNLFFGRLCSGRECG